ncbi:hypothetical protein AMATHDRAFT_49043 [Amanita thiersii Skay4041]|uniref:Uncharacterized protein n=1 Tax=Amanita thiersii Skay4041 TaxID=703135 RepID=A0A2A9NMV1_9AGAR|nr:hypothetical protein AMATHDRAFT_49043 [Amanita thiersii Skay4041]
MAMLQITGIISVVSSLFLGGPVLLGAITGGTTLAAIGIIGSVLGVVAIIAILFGIVAGAQKHAFLTDRDRECYAWTNEDPDWWSGPEDVLSSDSGYRFSSQSHFDHKAGFYIDSESIAQASRNSGGGIEDLIEPAATININYFFPQKSGSSELMLLTSDETSFQALDEDINNKWFIEYASGSGHEFDPLNPTLMDYTFTCTLANLTTKEFIEDCKFTRSPFYFPNNMDEG